MSKLGEEVMITIRVIQRDSISLEDGREGMTALEITERAMNVVIDATVCRAKAHKLRGDLERDGAMSLLNECLARTRAVLETSILSGARSE